MTDHPLLTAAQTAQDAHAAAQADPSALPDAIAAYEALGERLGEQYAALKAGVSGLEAFKLPRFLGFRREDGTYSGEGEA